MGVSCRRPRQSTPPPPPRRLVHFAPPTQQRRPARGAGAGTGGRAGPRGTCCAAQCARSRAWWPTSRPAASTARSTSRRKGDGGLPKKYHFHRAQGANLTPAHLQVPRRGGLFPRRQQAVFFRPKVEYRVRFRGVFAVFAGFFRALDGRGRVGGHAGGGGGDKFPLRSEVENKGVGTPGNGAQRSSRQATNLRVEGENGGLTRLEMGLGVGPGRRQTCASICRRRSSAARRRRAAAAASLARRYSRCRSSSRWRSSASICRCRRSLHGGLSCLGVREGRGTRNGVSQARPTCRQRFDAPTRAGDAPPRSAAAAPAQRVAPGALPRPRSPWCLPRP